MDVKTTFLNDVVEEEVYVEHPLGFETHDRESHVCRLKKSLYGLKQTHRTWYGRRNPVMLLLYVDDLFVTGMNGLIVDTKRKLAVEFKMKDLVMMHYFSRYGGVVEYGWNLPWTREVCSRDPEEVWDDGMQDYSHTNGIELEAIE